MLVKLKSNGVQSEIPKATWDLIPAEKKLNFVVVNPLDEKIETKQVENVAKKTMPETGEVKDKK